MRVGRLALRAAVAVGEVCIVRAGLNRPQDWNFDSYRSAVFALTSLKLDDLRFLGALMTSLGIWRRKPQLRAIAFECICVFIVPATMLIVIP